jgi:hypothetical protein
VMVLLIDFLRCLYSAIIFVICSTLLPVSVKNSINSGQ